MQGDGRRRWRDERKKGTMSKAKKKITILDCSRMWRKTVRCVVIRASLAQISDRSQIRRTEDASYALFHICICIVLCPVVLSGRIKDTEKL